MENGWIKLHRKLLSNEILRFDNNAYIVFTKLLLLVDRRTGMWRGGVRIRLADECNLKGTTTYQALLRLELSGMVTLESNSRFSEVSILKWNEYQTSDDKLDDNAMTTGRQPDDNRMTLLQEVKKEEVRTNNKTGALPPDPDFSKSPDPKSETNLQLDPKHKRNDKHKYYEPEELLSMSGVYGHYVITHSKNENQYTLSDKRKSLLSARLKRFTVEELNKAIDNAAAHPFYSGDNDRGWRADFEYIFRSDDIAEKMLTLKSVKPSGTPKYKDIKV